MTIIAFDRRSLLAGALAGIALNTSSHKASASLLPKSGLAYPAARVEPVIDDYYGTSITDPYRWMENPKDADWLPYLKAQNAHARSFLDAIPGREAMHRRISALTGDAALTRRVAASGDQLFYEQRPAGADNFKLFVRPLHGGSARILIDPTKMGTAEAHVSLDWWSPSPDGRRISYGLSESGSEASILHVMEVDTGRVLAERIPMTDFGIVSWLPDSSGFFYHQLTGERGKNSLYQNSLTRLHRIGTNAAADPIILKAGMVPDMEIAPVQIPIVRAVPGSDHAMAFVADIRTEHAIYTTPLKALLSGHPAWRKVAGFDDLVTGSALIGDELFLLSNKDQVRGRIMLTSAAAPDLVKAREVVPQGPSVLESIEAAKDGVIVTIMDGGVQRLGRIARGGAFTTLNMPFEGSVGGVFSSPDRDGAYLNLTGWLQPSAIYRLDTNGDIRDTGINPAPPIDVKPYETRRGFATARDGTRIPYTLVYRKGMQATGKNPTLISAYGAYQSSSTPAFSPRILALLDRGAVYAVANVRGGGEYGREWHLAGKKATKPNSWRDLIAVAEELVAKRITAPVHLGIIGGSAGGMTVGGAMAERPDLFAAVVNMVGWTNPIRYTAEQNVADIDEWGPITDAESFRIMYAMDAYHAVKDGIRYPAVLATTGATDPRVAPWHMAKYAARLQAASASEAPVLLRIDFDAGHGIGSTRAQTDALYADAYSFFLWQAGAPGFQPR
jgi:prolyl oligopeptidase